MSLAPRPSKRPLSSLSLPRNDPLPPPHLRQALAGDPKDLDNGERVVFNVGGTRFETTYATLKEFPEGSYVHNFLIKRAETSWCHDAEDKDGSYFVDQDPAVFGVLLSAARRKVAPKKPALMDEEEWLDGLRFWGIVQHDDVRANDECAKRVVDAEKRAESIALPRAMTMHTIISPYIDIASGSVIVLPCELAHKNFERDVGSLPADHAPVLDFVWGIELGRPSCRRCLWDLGLKVCGDFRDKRFRTGRAKKYPLLWRMLGGEYPVKKTMIVRRYYVSRRKPEDVFEVDPEESVRVTHISNEEEASE